jgi:hypothetical protein
MEVKALPYRIVKKIKRAESRPLVRSTDYAMNLGVDLEDEKTWKLYPLCRGFKSTILGEVSQLLDANGNRLHTVNESFEFDIHCSQAYGSNLNVVEKRFLYLPADLVRGYGVDENMVVDMLLREVISVQWSERVSIPLYPKILATGPIDVKPSNYKNSESMENMDSTDSRGKIAKIQSLMVLFSTGGFGAENQNQEYEQLYRELAEYFREAGIANPNPFSNLKEFYGFYRMRFRSYEERRDYIRDLYKDVEPLISNQKPKMFPKHEQAASTKAYDVFICHASEDKEVFVRDLAKALLSKNLKVWYDEFSLSLGDSLRRKIDYGISNSRYGIVVLSENFFKKDWPQKELDGLVAKEHGFDKVILPIWLGVTREQVASFSPILADRVAVSSNIGVDRIVNEILRAIR